MSGQMSIARALAERLARPVPEEVRAAARLRVLDWAACAVGGRDEPGMAEIRELAAREGAGPCRVIGGGRAGPQAAALANGPVGAVLEMDDVDKRALLHPGPVVIPAALAVAEANGGVTGTAFLDAVTRGYEAMIRVGRAAGASHYRFFHATASCGGFGAAAAGASLLSLDAERAAWALGAGGQQAFGLWQVRNEPGQTKAFHDGRAAANGVAAAFLAGRGFRAPEMIFEGPQGFFAALAPEADPRAVLDDPDGPWRLTQVSTKPHAACRHAHPAIDAALALRERLKGRAVAAVLVETYADAILFCDRPRPQTSGDAKFSLQHAVCTALLFGDADLPRFTQGAIEEPEVAAFRSVVAVSEDPAFTGAYPSRFGARVTVEAAGGEQLTAEVGDARGDPENPIDEAGIVAKAKALCLWGGMAPIDADRLIEVCLALGDRCGPKDLAACLPGASA